VNISTSIDTDAVIAEVAAAVGLAEGPSGVRDVILAITRAEPVAARDISRAAELPVPIVTAICNELRKRDIVDRGRPVRLTEAGRQIFGAGQRGLVARCPVCAGRGVTSPEVTAALTAELEAAAAAAPEAKPELDQTHCTVDTKINRVLALHEAGALAGTRIILLGDDDLVSVAIARFAALAQMPGDIRRLTVVDTDADVLACIAAQTAGTGVSVDLVQHDLREPLPDALAGGFDVACTDPPYTVPGAELFLSRAVAALAPQAGQHVFFSFGARRPDDMLRTQEMIAGMGLVLRGLTPNFNTYTGAGILGGTSHLYHLRSTEGAAPWIAGSYPGPLYTADQRAAVTRPYKCANCKAVHAVGPGSPWPKIASLQQAGCPDCGTTVFRPMPLQAR
jgi:predicted methyltransferase/DNA-directed RNA polymerase subunit RPC12/RpoP